MNTNRERYILVAEDDETDVLLLRRAFQTAGLTVEARFVFDGEEVLNLLEQVRREPRGMPPALIVLDLKMPRMDGLEVLEWLRADPGFRHLPVVIFSSSANQAEIDLAYALGVNAYLVKPPSLAERASIARFLKDWVALAQAPSPTKAGWGPKTSPSDAAGCGEAGRDPR